MPFEVDPDPEAIPPRWLLYSALVCVLFLWLRRTYSLEAVLDLPVADNAFYLNVGRHLPSLARDGDLFARMDDGLLYSALAVAVQWLGQLSPTDIFPAMAALLSLGLALSLFAVAVTRFRSPLAGVLVAGLMLSSKAGNGGLILPALLAVCILLVGLACLPWCGSPTRQAIVLAGTAWVASLARPEFGYGALAFLGAALWLTWRNRHRPERFRTAGLLVVSLLCVVRLWGVGREGSPEQYQRSTFAMMQHYSVNVVRSTGETRNPWFTFEEDWTRDFGGAPSLASALVANPWRAAWHVGRNLLQFPQAFLSMGPAHRADRVVLAILLFCSSGFIVWWRPRSTAGSNDSHLKGFGWLTVGLTWPALLAAVVIFPRPHYLVLPVSLLLLLWAAQWLPTSGWRRRPLPVFAFLFIVLACGTNAGDGHGLTPRVAPETQVIRLAIAELERQAAVREGTGLTIDNIDAYFAGLTHWPAGYRIYTGTDPFRTVERAVRDRGVDWLCVTTDALAHPHLAQLANGGPASGYTQVASAGTYRLFRKRVRGDR